MKSRMDAMIASSMKEASQGRTITPERQAVLDRMRGNKRGGEGAALAIIIDAARQADVGLHVRCSLTAAL